MHIGRLVLKAHERSRMPHAKPKPTSSHSWGKYKVEMISEPHFSIIDNEPLFPSLNYYHSRRQMREESTRQVHR